ncbi:hypothetical protein FisN_11Lh309 [Fistulifera solaris]|uniref:Uncharacterized protein n=1 Tax=Fistulifera solaris TaxID=1519565 RepID=A0A1Z5K107_FISSO|nr:hypothetical protein FisN_11Lh309 [Fistulifera solaris]|eukprot:GAX19822.1 hypothetical protein FisN_11Lh309 [Fistulifera solaris]
MLRRREVALLYCCLASICCRKGADATGARLVFQDELFVKQKNATVMIKQNGKEEPRSTAGGLRVKANAKKSKSSFKSSNSGKKSGKKKQGGPVRTVTIEPFLIGYMVPNLKERPPLNDVIDLLCLTEDFYGDAFMDNVLFQESFRSVKLTFVDDIVYSQAHGSFNYVLNLTAHVNFEKESFRKGFNDRIIPFMDDKVDLLEYVEDYVQEVPAFRSTVTSTIIVPSDEPDNVPVPSPVAPAPISPTPVGSPVTAPVMSPVEAPPSSTILPTSPGTIMPTTDRFDITLDLSEVPEESREVFTLAADRWSQVIIGDLAAIEGTTESSCGTLVPAEIDDLFICAKVESIDGIDGVLGSAGPEFARFTPTTIPYIGAMRFDSADVEALQAGGTLPSVILHEMGHVLGLGTLWTLNNLQTSAQADTATPPCPYNGNTKASAEFQAISGCAGVAVPIEFDGGPGTQCGHWEEDCLLDELMTGFSTGSLPLSRITVASLEDMGYVVDYDAADPYTAADLAPSCVCSSSLQEKDDETKDQPEEKGPGSTSNVLKIGAFSVSTLFSVPSEESVEKVERGSADAGQEKLTTRRHPSDQNLISNHTNVITRGTRSRKLSQEGRQIALDYGKKLLLQNKELKAKLPPELAARYVGDQAVIILYLEGGEIFSVEIQGD